MSLVEMVYKGQGVQPPNIFVEENEVDPLEKAGGWVRKAVADRDEKPEKAAKPAEEGVDNG